MPPVKNRLDDAVADATTDVFFENQDLAKLQHFIADVGISYEDWRYIRSTIPIGAKLMSAEWEMLVGASA